MTTIYNLFTFLSKPRERVDIEEYLRKIREAEEKHKIKAGDTLKHYHLEKKIGGGTFANVFRARDTKTNETVSVKVVGERVFGNRHRKEYITRFKREATILSNYRHPNIVNLRDFGQIDTNLFYVMDYIEGKDLSYHIPLGTKRAVKMAKSIADALKGMHRDKIYHRDIKTENIMVRCPGTEEEDVILIDFGIAKISFSYAPDLTAAGVMMGTIGFIPPEQIAGKPPDARGDIYSLTTVLYAALSGRTPFEIKERESESKFLTRMRKSKPPRLIKIMPSIDPELDRITAKGLNKNPKKRYQSCEEVIADLERFEAV